MQHAIPFSEVSKLKEAADKKFSAYVHFHDRCGGQFFSLEEENEEVKKFVEEYFAAQDIRAIFSEDGLTFTLEK